MNQTLKNIATPWHPRGGYALPYVPVLIVLGLILAFLAGAFTGSRITANFYRTHFTAPLPVPKGRTRIAVKVGTLPSAAGIYFRFLNTQNDDQGPLGSCQAWAAAKELSYGFNELYPYHYRLYSPRYLYDAVSAGQDNGSYLEQYPPVVLAHGIAPWSSFPYGASALNLGYSGYTVEQGVPSSIQSIAAAHHLSVSEQYLYGNPGAGMGGVELIKQQLAAHQPVNLDLEVFPEYDRSNADGSTVVPPLPGEVSRGGHANVAVYFDNGHRNPDGTSGAILASNQWSKEAGVGRDGIRHSTATNGFVWLSYNFVVQDTWGAAVLHVAQGSPGARVGKQPPFKGSVARRLVPPPAGASHHAPSFRRVATAGYFVHGVYATDRSYDLSPLFNQDGLRWGVSPVGLAATFGSECGLKTGVNGDCNRIGYGADVSGGGCQVTIGTAAGYGIGNGLSNAANIFSVFNWEDNPVNCIGLEAHIMHDYSAYRGGAQYAPLNILWNCGPATTAFPVPYGQCASNYYGDFLGWYNFALSHWATYQPPPPPPTPKPIHHGPRHHFNRARWCRAAAAKHTRCPSAFYGHHLTAIAFQYAHWRHAFHTRYSLDHAAGGVLSPEIYNRRGQYMKQVFQHAVAYMWLSPGNPTQWKQLPARRR